ncbi:MAG: tRNA lysidine(34) synthetase TilS [Nitrospira sp.]|nr:tRNA lysidine(34) synthetase TilS [Nitrospira sp.]
MTAAAIESAGRTGRRAWPTVLHHMVKTIRTRMLFEPGQHILVAVSGGPDSVALVSLLHRLRTPWRLTLSAAHGNYGLRGSESDGDQAFVEALCQRLDIPLHAMQLDVQNRARGTSLQAAARDVRYRALTAIAHQCGADRIAVGHTADDQAETVLLWMLRGAGLSGLSGMPACRDGSIVRPLFELRRREILAYLQSEAISFRRDSSNDKPIYLRNRVRHEIIPALQRVSPASVKTLCKLADVCREDDRYLDEQVAALSTARIDRLPEGEQMIDRLFLRELPLAMQRRLIHSSLQRCSPVDRPPSLHWVELVRQAVMKKDRVSNIAIPSGRVIVDKHVVRFFPPTSQAQPHNRPDQTGSMVLPVPGAITWTATGQRIHAERLLRKHIHETAHKNDRILMDADRIDGPLVVRAWQPGDRFCPFGMKGRSKKLQDFFTDLKVVGSDRTRIPVVATAEQILWVVGYRQDDRSVMTPATERCVVMTVDGPPAVRGK